MREYVVDKFSKNGPCRAFERRRILAISARHHKRIRQSRRQIVVAFILVDSSDFDERSIATPMYLSCRVIRPSRDNVHLVGEMVKKAHPIEVAHRVRFAFFQVQTDAPRRRGELIDKRQQPYRSIHHNLAADGKIKDETVRSRLVRSARMAQGAFK